jgi:hypothetical protein
MPVGKHRGRPIEALPLEYLEWLAALEDLREPLRSAVLAEHRRRLGPQPDPRIVEDLIARGQRSLAKSAHPDTGGSHEQMLAVRAAADWLFQQAQTLRELRA